MSYISLILMNGRRGCFRRDIDENDKEIFTNFISEVRSYTQTFSIKFRTSMRTYKRVKETLRFKGTVMNKSDGSRIVIGRVVPEADSHGNYNQITDMNYSLILLHMCITRKLLPHML
jgi:hypothetical protein